MSCNILCQTGKIPNWEFKTFSYFVNLHSFSLLRSRHCVNHLQFESLDCVLGNFVYSRWIWLARKLGRWELTSGTKCGGQKLCMTRARGEIHRFLWGYFCFESTRTKWRVVELHSSVCPMTTNSAPSKFWSAETKAVWSVETSATRRNIRVWHALFDLEIIVISKQ